MKLRLIMAASADGYLCAGPHDDMRWTGKDDKQAFRLLTNVGGVLIAGRATAELLPELKGRRVHVFSRTAPGSVQSLGGFAKLNPGAWLIGGPRTARRAYVEDLLDEVHMCYSPNCLFPGGVVPALEAVPDNLTPALEGDRGWLEVDAHAVGGVLVKHWRRVR